MSLDHIYSINVTFCTLYIAQILPTAGEVSHLGSTWSTICGYPMKSISQKPLYLNYKNNCSMHMNKTLTTTQYR